MMNDQDKQVETKAVHQFVLKPQKVRTDSALSLTEETLRNLGWGLGDEVFATVELSKDGNRLIFQKVTD